jgi:hypothetical protein
LLKAFGFFSVSLRILYRPDISNALISEQNKPIIGALAGASDGDWLASRTSGVIYKASIPTQPGPYAAQRYEKNNN